MVLAVSERAALFAGAFGKQWHFPSSGTAPSRVGTDSVQGCSETGWQTGDKVGLQLSTSICTDQKGVQGVVTAHKWCAVWRSSSTCSQR